MDNKDISCILPDTQFKNIKDLSDEFFAYKEQNLIFEVTEKINGQQMIVYFMNGKFGIYSDGIEIKEGDNCFWDVEKNLKLHLRLKGLDKNIIIIGEIVGPNIKDNYYNLDNYCYYVYDMYDSDSKNYCPSYFKSNIADRLDLNSAPLIHPLIEFSQIENIEEVVEWTKGNSCLCEIERQGLIFKSILDPSISFISISDNFSF